MTDCLNAIRERLEAATKGPMGAACLADHAPEDIAWLLERVEELEDHNIAIMVRADAAIEAAKADAAMWNEQYMRFSTDHDAAHVRIAALEEGLRRYGRHIATPDLPCETRRMWNPEKGCTCGLDTLLSTPQPQAKEEGVCTCGAAFDVGRYCACKEDGDGRPD